MLVLVSFPFVTRRCQLLELKVVRLIGFKAFVTELYARPLTRKGALTVAITIRSSSAVLATAPQRGTLPYLPPSCHLDSSTCHSTEPMPVNPSMHKLSSALSPASEINHS